MKARTLWLNIILLVALLVPGSIPATSQANAQAPAPIVDLSPNQAYPAAPDRIIVKFRDGVSGVRNTRGGMRTGLSTLDALLAKEQVHSARQLFPEAAQGMLDADLQRIFRLDLLPGSGVEAAVAALAAHPVVEWAEPDYLAYPTSNIPDDPLFPEQWGLTKIQAPEAWDIVTGTQTIVIAMVDSGIDLSHLDLVNRLWINPGEIPGNGLDDDNNGFVDDVRGWNFVHGTADIDDGNGHGTQVAGVAAAAADDGVGIAGVCWNCRIMPVRVMADSGVSNYSDIALGVRYAADKGAAVINLSLGGYAYSNALRDAINYAVNVKNAVVVGGAGNDNVATAFYPAAYENVLAVAATTNADTKAAFSDYGTWVDLSAPGETITTTFLGGDWGAANGTSLAAPFVSGVAALVRSQHPDWSAALVRNQLLQTADALDVLNPVYAGRLGTGRVNAMRATQDPHPIITLVGTSVNDDPLGRPTPGETATLAVTLRNDWWDATGVTGELATVDPLVTVEQATAGYGDLISSASGVSNPVYTFTVAAGAGYSHPIPFTLSISANNGAYTATISLTITTRSGDEHFSGTIIQNLTWTGDKRYIIDGNVGIAPGYTLTIEPGTEVRFNGNYNLNVGGTLVADGTEAEPILFTGHTGNAWGRIHFDDPSGDAQTTLEGAYEGGNILRYVRIEGAANGIGCTNATPYLEHVTLMGGGMICAGGDTALWIKDSDLAGDVQITEGSGVDSLYGGWVVRAPMPTPRFGLRATTAPDGLIYAIGGADASWNYYSSVEAYDPSTNTWFTRSPMPTARGFLGVVTAANGKIYAIGGNNGVNNDGSMGTVEEYDPTTDTWTTRSPMPTSRREFALVAADNGRIYAIGGLSDQVQLLNVVEEYDPWTDTWTARAPMPTARMALSAVSADNGRLYAIGGHIPPNNVALVEEYDPTTDTWTDRTPMPTIRASMGLATALNGRIYSMGGYGSTTTNRVDEYDPEQDAWSIQPLSPMSTARSNLGVARSADGHIYTIGGIVGDVTAILEKFTPPEPGAEHNGYNIIETTIHGELHVPSRCQVQSCAVSGDIGVNNNSMIEDTNAGMIVAGNGSTIQNNVTRGRIVLDGIGVIQGNITVDGEITITSGSVLSNTVRGGGILAGTGSVVGNNDIEDAPGWAISGGAATVIRNRIIGGANGIQTSGGLIQGNLIANIAGTGLKIGSATVVSNTFTGIGGNAVRITSGAPVKIAGNNFEFNTGTYDVENLILATSLPTIDARNNWWGTTEGNVIQTRIFDYSDDYTLGTVLYAPVLAAPATDAPAYVRSVTLTPESPVGIQTVTFDVEFSREMESSLLPNLTFHAIIVPEGDPLVGFYDTPAYAHDVAVSGGYAYVVDWDALRIIDVSDPAHPAEVGFYDTPGYARDVAVSGGYAYVADRPAGLRVIDVSDPARPAEVGFYDTPDDAHGVAVSGGYAYVADKLAGLRIIDVSNPAHPAEVGFYDTPDAYGVAVSSGYAYVADYDVGLRIIAVSDPAHPVEVGFYDTPDYYAYDVAVSGGCAYVTDQPTRVHIIDVSDPTRPAKVGFYDTLDSALGVAVSGEYAYVAGYGAGLRIYHTYRSVHEAVVDHPTWLSPNRYRASYDFTTLIPRDVYTFTVSEAVGSDGLKIARHSATTFIVDYAGAINDTTPPPMPSITGCAGTTSDTLSAEWSVNDPESAITLYQYAIGMTLGGAEVVNWTNTAATEMSRSGLALSNGQRVYISVRARNEGGLWSQAGSIGVVAGSGECDQNELPPIATFTGSPISGYAPLNVTFTDTSTGTVTSWAWTFGDGATSTAQHPTYEYTTPGTYTVALIVSGPGGIDTETKTNYITVNERPDDDYYIYLPLILRTQPSATTSAYPSIVRQLRAR